jgi:hypothetical protein
VVPVVMLGFGSMASHTVLEIRPCRRLSHPMLCCCVVLGCENGVWSSFVSPPSSLMARVTMAAHLGPVVLHFLVSLVVRLSMAFSRLFFGVSWLHVNMCAVSSERPQNGHSFGSPYCFCILSPVAHSLEMNLIVGIMILRLVVEMALLICGHAMLWNCCSGRLQLAARDFLNWGIVLQRWCHRF